MKSAELRLLLLVLILAAGLRFAGITFDSLWLDESYQSMIEATGQELPDFLEVPDQPFIFRLSQPRPLSEVLANFRRVDPLCPPLYATMLNRWMVAFGGSDLSVRSLSVVLSLASIGIVYLAARAMLGFPVAVLAVLVQAVSPFDIYYAQEARMYALTILSSAVSCACLFWILGMGRYCKRMIAALPLYSISTWALINSHYTGLFLLFFHGLYAAWWCISRRKLAAAGCLGAAWVGVFLLWLPWWEMFREAAALRTESFYVARSASWWWPLYALIVRIPINWLSFLAGKRVVLYAAPAYLTSLAALALAARASLTACRAAKTSAQSVADSASEPDALFEGRAKSSVGQSTAVRNAYLFLWLWALVPALAVWLLDVIESHRVIEISRYVVATSPAIYILAGAGLWQLWPCPSWSAGCPRLLPQRATIDPTLFNVVVFTHVCFALLNNLNAHTVPQREPWRAVARKMEAACHSDDLVVVSQYYDIVCLDRYLTVPLRQVGITPQLGEAHLERLLSHRRRFWLVTAQEGESAKDLVPARFRLKQQLDWPHGLHLRLYEE